MELQDLFYWMAIIYMSIMFIVMIIIVVAVLVIKHRVNIIQRHIEEKLNTVINAVHIGEAIVDKARDVFKRDK